MNNAVYGNEYEQNNFKTKKKIPRIVVTRFKK